ncbi:MAG: MFS transporter [Oscillospiraceae bacterium]|jgi:OPA family glycerol-3-phosphate transporter-like MFS transporter|nr:MFS transporter [Oscillospiraceae bacterium]
MDNALLKKGSRRLVAMCFFIYCMSYIGRLNFSACMADIVADTQMAKTFAGTISTGYLACYGGGQLLNGLIGDKISPKYMIFTGLLCSGVANVMMGVAENHILLLVFWCMNGYFHSMLWSPLIRSFAEWLPKDRQRKAGVSIAPTIPAGTLLAYGISALFLKLSGWRTVFFVSGGILICASAVWFLGVTSLRTYIRQIVPFKKQTEQMPVAEEGSGGPAERGKNVSLPAVILKTGLLFSVIGILFNGILKDGVTQWVPTFIAESFGVDASAASAVAMLLPVINLSGPYLAAFLDRRVFKNEMAASAVMFFISVLSIAALFFFGGKNMIVSAVLIAVCTSSMLGANSMFLTFMPFHFSSIGKSSSVTGFLNACSYLSSAVSSVTIGYIAQTKGWDVTILSWLAVAALGLLVCLAGIRVWRLGREKYARC